MFLYFWHAHTHGQIFALLTAGESNLQWRRHTNAGLTSEYTCLFAAYANANVNASGCIGITLGKTSSGVHYWGTKTITEHTPKLSTDSHTRTYIEQGGLKGTLCAMGASAVPSVCIYVCRSTSKLFRREQMMTQATHTGLACMQSDAALCLGSECVTALVSLLSLFAV